MNIFPVHPPAYSEPPTSKNLGGTLTVAVMKTRPAARLFQLCLGLGTLTLSTGVPSKSNGLITESKSSMLKGKSDCLKVKSVTVKSLPRWRALIKDKGLKKLQI